MVVSQSLFSYEANFCFTAMMKYFFPFLKKLKKIVQRQKKYIINSLKKKIKCDEKKLNSIFIFSFHSGSSYFATFFRKLCVCTKLNMVRTKKELFGVFLFI